MTNPEATGDSVTRERADAAPEMSASDAVRLIREGKPIQNVLIRGLRLRGEFELPVEFKHVTLLRPNIDGAHFKQSVTFAGCRVDNLRIGRKSVFEQGLVLSGSTLRRARLHDFTVRGPMRCDNANTLGALQVSHARFEGIVRLWECRMGGWVEFRECVFCAEADFRSFHAEAGVSFEKCHFTCDMLLRGAAVAKKLDCASSQFDALLDLSKAKLHDFAYLENIVQGPKQQFALLNAVAERILIRPDQIAGRLASESSRDFVTAMQEYGLLKRIFQNLHRYEEEDWAFYQFKINQRRSHHRSWLRPWSKLAQLANWVLLDLGCGYGTNPVRAVLAATMITLGFAGLYMIGIGDFHMEHAPLSTQSTHSVPNRMLFALLTSVSVFTSGLSGDLVNRAGGWMYLPLVSEAILGTLLWGLFVVAFSRKVIR